MQPPPGYERYQAAMRVERHGFSRRRRSEHERRFLERLDDDLDTPGALDELDALAADLTAGREDVAPEVDGGALLEQAARHSRSGDGAGRGLSG